MLSKFQNGHNYEATSVFRENNLSSSPCNIFSGLQNANTPRDFNTFQSCFAHFVGFPCRFCWAQNKILLGPFPIGKKCFVLIMAMKQCYKIQHFISNRKENLKWRYSRFGFMKLNNYFGLPTSSHAWLSPDAFPVAVLFDDAAAWEMSMKCSFMTVLHSCLIHHESIVSRRPTFHISHNEQIGVLFFHLTGPSFLPSSTSFKIDICTFSYYFLFIFGYWIPMHTTTINLHRRLSHEIQTT